LLIVCKSEEQKRKAMSVESIGKKRVESKRVLGEKKDPEELFTEFRLMKIWRN